MSLHVYFDESRTFYDPQGEVVAIGGCVFHDVRLAAFNSDWVLVLKRHGVSRLHMREGSHRAGGYRGWAVGKWEGFLQELLTLLRRDATAF